MKSIATWTFLVFGAFMSDAGKTYACSSCGTGGDDPLVLFPNENIKTYVGLTHGRGYRNVLTDGRVVANHGVTNRQTILMALGMRFSHRAFITLAVPFVTNTKESIKEEGFGDPNLGLRYDFLRQTIANPWIPQVQAVVGYKSGQARGPHESRHRQLLDVYGSGFDEYRYGADVWWAMTALVGGFGYSRTESIEESTSVGDQQPGTQDISNITVGYTNQSLKAISGIVRKRQGQRFAFDGLVPQSDSVAHSIFSTIEIPIMDQDFVRATYSRGGLVGRNSNTSQSTNFQVAWMRSW